jgi:hypothetical protein
MKSFERTAESIELDPCSSYWLKERIKELRERDPFDALRDIETLNWLFEMRAEELKASYMKEL